MATNMKGPKQRFKILEFINPRTKTTSWRVSGIKRNGERIRENFADSNEAQLRYTELEGEFHAASGAAALRATRLADEQVAIAEAGFKRLEMMVICSRRLIIGCARVNRQSPRNRHGWMMR
jgi:hypothetical protein